MPLDLYSIRKSLHSIPEMAFEELQTQALLLSYLKDMDGILIHQFEGITGILVEYSHGTGAYKLFRADMDALPVQEKTGCTFSSGIPGMMHACGHDIHMTVLLGLIEKVLSKRPRANLLFLFQPAEEGKGGAEAILAQGLIQKYNLESVYALHVASGLPVGTISSRAGIFFGIPQEFDVVFTGKAAHAAYPEKGINALDAGLTFITLMNSDIEDLKAEHPVIFHIGHLKAGTIRNVVPATCVIEGTHRSLEKSSRDAMNRYIRENAALAADQTGASVSVDLLCSYDPVINNEALVERLKDVCGKLQLPYIQADAAMTGEDFGFFTTIYPGLLFWLGSGTHESLHSDQYLPDEKCIDIGIAVFEKLI